MVGVGVADYGCMVSGVGELKVMGGLQIPNHSFGGLPVGPGQGLSELAEDRGREGGVRSCGHRHIHE